MATNASIITRDTDVLASKAGSLYESVFVASKRAQQIAIKTKDELTQKLGEFASSVDNLEEIFENREQIEISKFYERQPKPTSMALDEILSDQLVFKNKDEEQA
jgi:DNA-directed RNA polymerase subunit K/omega